MRGTIGTSQRFVFLHDIILINFSSFLIRLVGAHLLIETRREGKRTATHKNTCLQYLHTDIDIDTDVTVLLSMIPILILMRTVRCLVFGLSSSSSGCREFRAALAHDVREEAVQEVGGQAPDGEGPAVENGRGKALMRPFRLIEQVSQGYCEYLLDFVVIRSDFQIGDLSDESDYWGDGHSCHACNLAPLAPEDTQHFSQLGGYANFFFHLS
jgi:hypothetical protein